MTESVKYTPKQVAYNTGIGYRTILRDIERGILKAKKDGGQSYIISQLDLVVYLALVNKDVKEDLFISFKGNIPKTKISLVTEEFMKTFNEIKDKHKIHLSVNIKN